MPVDTDPRIRIGMRMIFAVLVGLVVFGYGGVVESLAGTGDLVGPAAPPSAPPPADPVPTPPTTTPDTRADPSTVSGDTAENNGYVTIMRAYLSRGRELSRAELIDLGHDACRALDQVQPDRSGGLAEAVDRSGIEAAHPGEAHVVFGAATSAYCRQWNWLFRG